MDTNPVKTAPDAPPPISGGTLLITRDGTLAVAADPDRNRVSIVSMGDATVYRTVDLEPGDEPGRLVEDANRRVHVVLRRGGAVVAIDLATGTEISRRRVCGAPRGIAYEGTTDRIHVACAGGELVSLSAAGGNPVRVVRLDVDLRDVVAQPDGLAVSRFKSGDVLFVDASGKLSRRTRLTGVRRVSTLSADGDPLEPAVAWRMIATPNGGDVLLLHQYAFAATIDLNPPTPSVTEPSQVPYGAFPCGGLVAPAISRIGDTPRMGLPISAPVLTVDAAVSADGRSFALVHAGQPNSDGLVTFVPTGQTVLSPDEPTSCIQATRTIHVSGQTTAIAFNPSDAWPAEGSGTSFAVQTRQPASIVLFGNMLSVEQRTVDLNGSDVSDTGHDLFHQDTGTGIACASCHPEGTEDGRVWKFDPIGDRRTQAVNVGLKGTEPFHWDGDMTDFSMLVDEVMVHRMGSVPESAERKAALRDWLFQLRPPAAIISASDDRAVRGKALFASADVGCSGCHAGPKLTSNRSAFVGTTEAGKPLQVPSLRGVGYRTPFLHNGCAATLRARFDPACGGGDLHGKTSQLTDDQIGDLVSYLESL
jgi:mono/diheme cytochrome c family protein